MSIDLFNLLRDLKVSYQFKSKSVFLNNKTLCDQVKIIKKSICLYFFSKIRYQIYPFNFLQITFKL